jgi:hypothetical protein
VSSGNGGEDKYNSVGATTHVESSPQSTEQAKLDATCSDEILDPNAKSAPLLGSHLKTPLFRPGN